MGFLFEACREILKSVAETGDYPRSDEWIKAHPESNAAKAKEEKRRKIEEKKKEEEHKRHEELMRIKNEPSKLFPNMTSEEEEEFWKRRQKEDEEEEEERRRREREEEDKEWYQSQMDRYRSMVYGNDEEDY